MISLSRTTRLLLALILALTFVGFSASTARATPPVMGEFDAGGSYIFEGLCDFPLDVMSQYHVHWTDFFDKDGNFVKEVWHGVQTDTFSANGKTLESLPFHWNISFAADDPMGLGVGVLEQVPLPDGGLFISAGQVYFGNEAVFVPDRGAFVNLEGFCAALAP